jgi:hypothetical protein
MSFASLKIVMSFSKFKSLIYLKTTAFTFVAKEYYSFFFQFKKLCVNILKFRISSYIKFLLYTILVTHMKINKIQYLQNIVADLFRSTITLSENIPYKQTVALSPRANYTDWRPPIVDEI